MHAVPRSMSVETQIKDKNDRKYNEFHSDFNLLNKQNCLIKFKRNSNIFYNFENLKKTDHCLEMPADWEVSIL